MRVSGDDLYAARYLRTVATDLRAYTARWIEPYLAHAVGERPRTLHRIVAADPSPADPRADVRAAATTLARVLRAVGSGVLRDPRGGQDRPLRFRVTDRFPETRAEAYAASASAVALLCDMNGVRPQSVNTQLRDAFGPVATLDADTLLLRAAAVLSDIQAAPPQPPARRRGAEMSADWHRAHDAYLRRVAQIMRDTGRTRGAINTAMHALRGSVYDETADGLRERTAAMIDKYSDEGNRR